MSVDVQWLSKRLQRMIMTEKRSADGTPEDEPGSKEQRVEGFQFACRVGQSSIKGEDGEIVVGLKGLFPDDLDTFNYLKNEKLPIALYPGIVRDYTFKNGRWVANKVYGKKPDVCDEKGHPEYGVLTAPHYAIEIRGNEQQRDNEASSKYFILDVVNRKGCLRRDWQDLYVGQEKNQFDVFLYNNSPQLFKQLRGRVKYNAWMANEPPNDAKPNVIVRSFDIHKPLIKGTSACIAMYANPDAEFNKDTELYWCYGTQYGDRSWTTSCETAVAQEEG